MRPCLSLCSAVLVVLPLCGCASYSNTPNTDTRYADNTPRHRQQNSDNRSAEGRVSGIEQLSAQSSGGGALLGAVLGGVLGNQVGDGSGRRAATGVGAIGGAVLGNEMEKNRAAPRGYRISVDFDDGHSAEYDYQSIGDLRIGDRIRVDHGQLTRM